MPSHFKHAICNEVYEKRPFAETCKSIRAAGYQGIEIAPFTLAEDPASIPAATRREYSAAIESEGLRFAGLHWLLVSPKGLHVTTPDKALRDRSWEYVRKLVDLCADLGPRGVMVFGSPKQRSSTGGLAPADAARLLTDGLAGLAPHALDRGVTILIEALPNTESDVVTSLDEAARIVRAIGSEAVRTMFDCHNAMNETEPHSVLVDRHFDVIRHVHINETDGRHPGTGAYDYRAVLEVLARRGYRGWLSLEVFDFSAGADKIAADSLRYMESEIAKIA
jgi:sugar phosphate isomerase/epimerase